MEKGPSASSSAFTASFLFLAVLSILELYADKLASTPQLTIVGGFISSLLFVFFLLAVGNLQKETKWFEVILSLIVALTAAATVHRVSVTTCFLFSVGFIFLLNYVAQQVHSGKKKN